MLTTLSTNWKKFHPDCVAALKKVLDNTDASIVLSSCWRHGFIDWNENGEGRGIVHSTQAIRKLQELFTEVGIDPSRLIDKTPDVFNVMENERGAEISKWLSTHEDVECFVILDDSSDIEPHKDQWVMTDEDNGMSMVDADKAIRLLQGV